MARDPLSWSLEDEKRRARGRPLTPAEFAVWDQPSPPPRPERAPAPRPGPGFSDVEAVVFDQPARPARPERMPGAPSRGLARDISRGYDVAGIPGAIAGAAAQRPVAPPPPPVAPSRPSFENVESDAAPTQTDLRDPRLGLTRITRLPDGSFTDTAAPGAGQDRYYDRTGTRVDTAAYGDSYGLGDASVSGPDAVRAYNRSVNASALDMTDPANQRLVAERGTRGLARSAAMQQEALARAAYTAEMQMTPEQRAERDIEMMKEAGLDRRAVAQLQGRMALEQAKLLAEQEGREFDANQALIEQMNADRAYRREDPEGFVREQMAMLENLPPAVRRARLADPDDPIAGALRAAVRQRGAEMFGDDWTPGQASRTSGLRQFFGGGRYNAENRGWLTANDTFDPSDLYSWMSPEDFEALMGADIDERRER